MPHVEDIYPQWFNLNRAQEAVLETPNEVETQMPIRISDRQVMEILGIMWHIKGSLPGNLAIDATSTVHAQLTKRPIAPANIDLIPRNNIIDWVSFETNFSLITSGAGYNGPRENVIWHDFSSSGRGFLLASQSIHLLVVTITDADGASERAAASVRILYKLVEVSAQELIGLVRE